MSGIIFNKLGFIHFYGINLLANIFGHRMTLETLVIYSVCKCDTRPSVKYLMREEKELFGEDL